MKKVKAIEIAQKWRLSERTIRNYCQNGLLKGATKVGKTWYIDADSKKPIFNIVKKINLLR